MRTNRDLDEFVDALPATDRRLETYLRALAALVAPHRHADGLALETFAGMLRAALTSEPARTPPPDPNAFEELLWRQIGQLPRTRSAGPQEVYVKAGESRWYNTLVATFLERGVEGAFHGWGAEGEDLEEMPFLSWEDLREFLVHGQYYE